MSTKPKDDNFDEQDSSPEHIPVIPLMLKKKEKRKKLENWLLG